LLLFVEGIQAMPMYVYQEILPNGSEGERFDVLQKISDPPLTVHPRTGNAVRRVVTAAYTPKPFLGHDKKEQLSDRNLENLGFTKYVKGKGGYEKTAGDGPDLLKR
jgi:hypothetical protein